MNDPVWDVAFGAGLSMALLAIVHLLASHFAVGDGPFLALTEHKARRNNDTALPDWPKFHTEFFVLVTVVFGAVCVVVLWFVMLMRYGLFRSTKVVEWAPTTGTSPAE